MMMTRQLRRLAAAGRLGRGPGTNQRGCYAAFSRAVSVPARSVSFEEIRAAALKADARGCDGDVRQELAAGIGRRHCRWRHPVGTLSKRKDPAEEATLPAGPQRLRISSGSADP